MAAGYQLNYHELHKRQLLVQSKLPFVVVAIGVQNIQNIGAIFRICDAVGCQELIFVDCNLTKPSKIRKVSRNTSQHISYKVVSTSEFLRKTINNIPPLYALEITSQSISIFDMKFPSHFSVIIGGEKHGVPEAVLQHCVGAFHLPMYGINSSMNVAVSLAIALYQIRGFNYSTKQSGKNPEIQGQ